MPQAISLTIQKCHLIFWRWQKTCMRRISSQTTPTGPICSSTAQVQLGAPPLWCTKHKLDPIISMSPPLNHEQLTSPGTPGHDFLQCLRCPNSGGTWNIISLEGHHPWGSSPHEELPETSNLSFNITCQNNSSMTCKDSGSVSHAQRLDSFSKAFPTKNIELLFGDSYRTDDKHPGKSHFRGFAHALKVSQKDQTGKVWSLQFFNPMVIQGQCNQTGFHPSESQNSMHGLYQNHQQFHYGYQQQEQKLNNIEQVNRSLQKPQSSWHGYQSHPTPYPMAWTNNKEGFMHTKLIWILMNLLNRQPMTTVKTSKCQSSRSSITKTNNIFVCFPNPAILPRARSRAIDPCKAKQHV